MCFFAPKTARIFLEILFSRVVNIHVTCCYIIHVYNNNYALITWHGQRRRWSQIVFIRILVREEIIISNNMFARNALRKFSVRHVPVVARRTKIILAFSAKSRVDDHCCFDSKMISLYDYYTIQRRTSEYKYTYGICLSSEHVYCEAYIWSIIILIERHLFWLVSKLCFTPFNNYDFESGQKQGQKQEESFSCYSVVTVLKKITFSEIRM